MHVVLDLDLDFFVWPVDREAGESGPRLPEDRCKVQAAEQVRAFMEDQCGLSKDSPLPGRMLTLHIEAFSTWREWLEKNRLEAPFTVVHIDAHSDLGSGGLGNNSPKFYETELMALPLEKRRFPREGADGMHSGNYLLAAIANEWICRLEYVYPIDPEPIDLTQIPALRASELGSRLRIARGEEDDHAYSEVPGCFYKDDDPTTHLLQLRHLVYGQEENGAISSSREVEFATTAAPDFQQTEITHIVVAQSPSFTPASADVLLSLLLKYIKEE
jgi:hypothetical protein